MKCQKPFTQVHIAHHWHKMQPLITTHKPVPSVCAAEVFLLGSLRDWPQLEIRHGFTGTVDRPNGDIPGVCCALHVQQRQPSLLDCQVGLHPPGCGIKAAGSNARSSMHTSKLCSLTYSSADSWTAAGVVQGVQHAV